MVKHPEYINSLRHRIRAILKFLGTTSMTGPTRTLQSLAMVHRAYSVSRPCSQRLINWSILFVTQLGFLSTFVPRKPPKVATSHTRRSRNRNLRSLLMSTSSTERSWRLGKCSMRSKSTFRILIMWIFQCERLLLWNVQRPPDAIGTDSYL